MSDAHTRLRVRADVGAVRLHVDVEFGAVWTVVFGPSGSGKSSLLRAICGSLPGGSVEVGWPGPAGSERSYDGVAPFLRGIAYAPQEPSLFPMMTVRENVEFAGSVRSRRQEKLLEDLLRMFELEELAGRRPRELSGGEQQRVNLARAFAVPEARLMLLDEPFTGVGRAQREVLLPKMREAIEQRGVQVISVTHDVEEAYLLGAEVVRLEAGRVVAQGAVEVVLDPERQRILRVLGRGNESIPAG